MLNVCEQVADKDDAGMLNMREQLVGKAWAPACSTSARSSTATLIFII